MQLLRGLHVSNVRTYVVDISVMSVLQHCVWKYNRLSPSLLLSLLYCMPYGCIILVVIFLL